MDEKLRTTLDEAISDARGILFRENKWNADSEETRTENFKRLWRAKTTWVLMENEQRRRRQLKAQMQEEGREQKKQEEELDERKRKRQHEVDWETTRDQRIGSWRDFSAGKSGDKKKKTKKMKPIG